MTAEVELDDQPTMTILLRRKFTCFSQIEIEPVGKWYHQYESSRTRHPNATTNNVSEEESSEEDDDSDKPEIIVEDDISFLRTLDPADWKKQDHYSVLGLKTYRYKASDEDIKKAYRVMVLRHHPDKRKGAGEEIREDDDYFTCITKAYETLGVPSKRRAYDSVDAEFDDDIPKATEVGKTGFFELFGPVFERNARWSTRNHVCLLGKNDDSKEKVEKFYNFWYDFDSWREFSYLDEEEKEKGQDREERRWIDKQNRAERARRKKEEMGRIRKVVDLAYANDPRILRFKEEERERRLAVKKARQEAVRQRIEDEERARKAEEEAIKKKKEDEERELKAKQEKEKKEREAIKKAIKKERKTLRTVCKESQYFTNDETERVDLMTNIELICEALACTQLNELNEQLSKCNQDRKKSKQLLLKRISLVKEQVEKERQDVTLSTSKVGSVAAPVDSNSSKFWHPDDITVLIKAVNLFPAGTNKRWEVVSEYINQHSTTNKNRGAKEVLSKAKELQKSDVQMREVANKNAFTAMEKIQKNNASTESVPSERLETPQEMLGVNLTTWAADEQKLLEQALKTFPSTTKDRWDRIADCVPNRSKKDCMKRYKELVEMVKAKKAAQVAVSKK